MVLSSPHRLMKLSEMPYCLGKLLTGVTSKQVQNVLVIHSIATISFSTVWYGMLPPWIQRMKHFITILLPGLSRNVEEQQGEKWSGGPLFQFSRVHPVHAVLLRCHQWNGENTDVFVRAASLHYFGSSPARVGYSSSLRWCDHSIYIPVENSASR